MTAAHDLRARIEHDFALHSPKSLEVNQDLDFLRQLFTNAALAVEEIGRPGREQATAITKLEEALYWSIASVVRYQDKEVSDGR